MINNKYIIILDQCGVGVRINENKFKSYSYHNFKTPKNIDPVEYQKKRWARFIKLCAKIMENVSIVKNGKCIFTKGGITSKQRSNKNAATK